LILPGGPGTRIRAHRLYESWRQLAVADYRAVRARDQVHCGAVGRGRRCWEDQCLLLRYDVQELHGQQSKLDRVYVAIAECPGDDTNLFNRAGDAVRDPHGGTQISRNENTSFPPGCPVPHSRPRDESGALTTPSPRYVVTLIFMLTIPEWSDVAPTPSLCCAKACYLQEARAESAWQLRPHPLRFHHNIGC